MSKRRFAEACSDFLDASLSNLSGAKSSGASRAPLAVSTDEQRDRLPPNNGAAGAPLWPTRQQLSHMALNDQVDAITANLKSFSLDGRGIRGKFFGGGSPTEREYVRAIQHRLRAQMGKLGRDTAAPAGVGGAGGGFAGVSATFPPPAIVASRASGAAVAGAPKRFVHSPLAVGCAASPAVAVVAAVGAGAGLPDFSPRAPSSPPRRAGVDFAPLFTAPPTAAAAAAPPASGAGGV